MQETWVHSLGWADPLEKEIATHSSILVWRIPWTGAVVRGVAKSWTTATKEQQSGEPQLVPSDQGLSKQLGREVLRVLITTLIPIPNATLGVSSDKANSLHTLANDLAHSDFISVTSHHKKACHLETRSLILGNNDSHHLSSLL